MRSAPCKKFGSEDSQCPAVPDAGGRQQRAGGGQQPAVVLDDDPGRQPLVGPLTTGTVVEYHRWLLAAAGALLPAASVWYGRALRLF